MKKIILSFSFSIIALSVFAQQDPVEPLIVRQKMFDHHLGVQVNQLIQQVLNFSGNINTNLNNPYLLVYSLTYKKLGLGLRIGAGYNYKSFTQDDGVTSNESKLNDYQLRIGIEKSITLSRRWEAGAGLDFIYTNNDDYTKSIVRSVDTVTTITKSKIPSSGGGAMAWLRFHITDRILLGTETSFYYQEGTNKQDISVTRHKNGNLSMPVTTTNTNVDNKNTSGAFSLPLVFYLLIKF
jgi:hypothetical protein